MFSEYIDYVKFLKEEFDSSNNISYPLLIHAFEEYQESNNKIMVIGQETNGWIGDLDFTLSSHDIVVKSIEHYKEFELGNNYYNSPFWRFCKKAKSVLTKSSNLKEIVWTNLSKFDVDESTPNKDIRNRNKKGYALLKKEISIFKPDIILFLTSWKNDEVLMSIFDDVKISKIDDYSGKYLSRVVSNDLPVNSFRTYHPRFLPTKKSKYNENEIIKMIKNNMKNTKSMRDSYIEFFNHFNLNFDSIIDYGLNNGTIISNDQALKANWDSVKNRVEKGGSLYIRKYGAKGEKIIFLRVYIKYCFQI